jgi:hypothetical protein
MSLETISEAVPRFPERLGRAKGNLTYVEFIALVQQLWSESHPDIPFFATSGSQLARYPAIVYGLQLRKTHPQEPKPRVRENIRTAPDQPGIIITGQRFQNIVNFSVVTENDPEAAEAIIEAFEDFMQEMTPVFKEMGLSEFAYARRLPDSEETKSGEDIVKRTVCYMVTTEKVTQTSVDKLRQIIVHSRMLLQQGALAGVLPDTMGGFGQPRIRWTGEPGVPADIVDEHLDDLDNFVGVPTITKSP